MRKGRQPSHNYNYQQFFFLLLLLMYGFCRPCKIFPQLGVRARTLKRALSSSIVLEVSEKDTLEWPFVKDQQMSMTSFGSDLQEILFLVLQCCKH